MIYKNITLTFPIAIAFLFLSALDPVLAQADSVTSRRPVITIAPPAEPGLTALTQGPRLTARAGGVGAPATFCSSAYINNSGVVLSVMIYGPQFGTTELYTTQTSTGPLNWTSSARVNDTTSAQGFVAPGGYFCVLSTTGRGIGTFEVTIFKANAQPSEYPEVALWTDTVIGTCSEALIRNEGDGNYTTVYFDRRVLRREFTTGQTTEYYFEGANGWTRAATNPNGGVCPA